MGVLIMKINSIKAMILGLLMVLSLGSGTSMAAVGTGLTIDPGIIIPNKPLELMLAPSGLTAVANSATQITLTWQDNSSNETGFQIERKKEGESYVNIAVVGAGVSTYTDNSLSAGTKYYYRVRMKTAAAYSTYSNETSATTKFLLITKPGNDTVIDIPVNILLPGSPAAPEQLTAIPVAGNQIKLTWVDKSDNETGFKLERKSGSQGYTEIALLNANAVIYGDTEANDGQLYTYRIKAFNSVGSSAYSNEASGQLAVNIEAQTAKTIVYRIGQTVYYVDGTAYTMDVAPTIIESTTFMPIRYVGEPLGAVLTWDQSQQKASFSLDGTTVDLWVGSNIAKINGVDTPISSNPNVTPQIISNRLFIPAAFVATSLGCDVTWDGALQEVTVYYYEY